MEWGIYGSLQPLNEWQKELLFMLKEKGAGAFPIEMLPHAHLPGQVQEIHCFCLDELPRAAWNLFCSDEIKASIYLFSPCRMFWEDLRTDRERRLILKHAKKNSSSWKELEGYLRDAHPLLANWGRLGRKTLEHLSSKSFETVELYGEESHDFSLLQKVQEDLLNLSTLSDEPREAAVDADGSIRIRAVGSSRVAEMELLRDSILELMERCALLPSEILVLAPKISVYEQALEFVFGDDLPYSLHSSGSLSGSSYCRTFLMFLHLAESRWEADDVLELLEQKEVSLKYGISSEDLVLIRKWLEEVNIRGGLQEQKGNWIEGLKNLVNGLIYLFPEGAGPNRARSIDWGQADLLDRFLALMQKLRLQAENFRSSKTHTLKEWNDLFVRAAEDLFSSQEADAERPFHSFLRTLSSCALKIPDENIPCSIVRLLFEEECSARTGGKKGFLLEAIRFCSLSFGSIHSARAVFLIGMESDQFPQKKSRCSFDWATDRPDSSDCGRYLLLQALFAAREHLCISYCHLSPEDGKPIEPALPIQELLQTIDAFYPHALIVEYPSPLSDAASETLPIFWPKKLEPRQEEMLKFELNDLDLLFRNPWSFLLKKRLGLWVKEESLFSERRMNDFSLPAYIEQKWMKESMHGTLDSVLKQNAYELPPGAFGIAARLNVEQKVKKMQEALRKWGIQGEEVRIVSIRHEAISSCGRRTEIVGELHSVVKTGLLLASEVDFIHLLRLWPRILLFMASQDTDSATVYSLKSGRSKTFKKVPVDRALTRLIDYALLARLSFSPLIEPWAEAFLRKEKKCWMNCPAAPPLRREDPVVRFVEERTGSFDYDAIWKEWNGPLQEIFEDFVYA
jgi:exonuclease V gamma subunit